ncbi:hypothetical protein CIHG_07061 [Coccidioides immitis H538.4]|uniref:Uncharacterized protein n=1 Tax=Coccidioides immitis H538.4 TaxID=396776 RepID=A0A0J8RY64_COCIT|nr:hypothetical protein CIHG_07061 [Coccidioides immitis H538.4]
MDSQGLRPKKTKRKGVPTISLHTRSNAYFYNLPHHKILSQMWIIHHRHNLKGRRPKKFAIHEEFPVAPVANSYVIRKKGTVFLGGGSVLPARRFLGDNRNSESATLCDHPVIETTIKGRTRCDIRSETGSSDATDAVRRILPLWDTRGHFRQRRKRASPRGPWSPNHKDGVTRPDIHVDLSACAKEIQRNVAGSRRNNARVERRNRLGGFHASDKAQGLKFRAIDSGSANFGCGASQASKGHGPQTMGYLDLLLSSCQSMHGLLVCEVFTAQLRAQGSLFMHACLTTPHLGARDHVQQAEGIIAFDLIGSEY